MMNSGMKRGKQNNLDPKSDFDLDFPNYCTAKSVLADELNYYSSNVYSPSKKMRVSN